MANTTKAYEYQGGYLIDCTNGLQYHITDNAVTQLGTAINTSGFTEAYFDSFIEAKIGNAKLSATHDRILPSDEITTLTQLIIEKSQDFD